MMDAALFGLALAAEPRYSDIGDAENGPRLAADPPLLASETWPLDFASITDPGHPDRHGIPYSIIRQWEKEEMQIGA